MFPRSFLDGVHADPEHVYIFDVGYSISRFHPPAARYLPSAVPTWILAAQLSEALELIPVSPHNSDKNIDSGEGGGEGGIHLGEYRYIQLWLLL